MNRQTPTKPTANTPPTTAPTTTLAPPLLLLPLSVEPVPAAACVGVALWPPVEGPAPMLLTVGGCSDPEGSPAAVSSAPRKEAKDDVTDDGEANALVMAVLRLLGVQLPPATDARTTKFTFTDGPVADCRFRCRCSLPRRLPAEPAPGSSLLDDPEANSRYTTTPLTGSEA